MPMNKKVTMRIYNQLFFLDKIQDATIWVINDYIGGTFWRSEDVAAWYAQEFSKDYSRDDVEREYIYKWLLSNLKSSGAYFDYEIALLSALEYEERGSHSIAAKISYLPISNYQKLKLSLAHPKMYKMLFFDNKKHQYLVSFDDFSFIELKEDSSTSVDKL